MKLCFDIGNTDIFGGVFCDGKRVAEFRRSSRARPSADELGVFLLQFLDAQGLGADTVEDAALASVVPDCGAEVAEACRRYLKVDPLVLKAGVRTGLKIRTRNPNEVGADRIANAIAAVDVFPGAPLIVIDMGTATTFCAITADKDYLGGVIAAGMNLSMQALAERTAKLPYVELVQPNECLGRTTMESIQSGLYYGHLGMMRTVIEELQRETFGGERPKVIGTGGNARFFKATGIFDAYRQDLVLTGLLKALELNRKS